MVILMPTVAFTATPDARSVMLKPRPPLRLTPRPWIWRLWRLLWRLWRLRIRIRQIDQTNYILDQPIQLSIKLDQQPPFEFRS